MTQRKQRRKPAAKAKDPAGDLRILFPDVTLTVADPDTGEDTEVTVREFRFLEGLKAQAIARPLAAALAAGTVLDDGGKSATADGVISVITEHAGIWIELLAMAADRDPEWIGRLRDTDGDRMSTAMWEANKAFFTRAVLAIVQGRRKAAET